MTEPAKQGKYPSPFPPRRHTALLLSLVASLVLLVTVFATLARYENRDQHYLLRVMEQQFLAQQLGKIALTAGNGNLNGLQETRDRFVQQLGLLERGDPATGVPPSPSPRFLQEMKVHWEEAAENIEFLLSHSSIPIALQQQIPSLQHTLREELLPALDELMLLLVEKTIPSSALNGAGRLRVLASRLGEELGQLRQGEGSLATALDTIHRDSRQFGRLLLALQQGDDLLAITALGEAESKAKLGQIVPMYQKLREGIDGLLGKMNSLSPVQEATSKLASHGNQLIADSKALADEYRHQVQQRLLTPLAGYLLAGLSLVLLLGLRRRLVEEAKKIQESGEQLQRQLQSQRQQEQAAILRLLNEIAGLASGDLTVEVTVTEDFTGAIADAINYAVEALRNLVVAINRTTLQVSGAAQESQATAMHLAEASEHQAEEILRASSAVTLMSRAMGQAAGEAHNAVTVAQHALQVAKQGSETVRGTLKGMHAIHSQMQETAKKIKKLGDSSQEIGEIIRLINDIADQTNILALNAAIQAAMAGDAGRGFAVVADEVQRLAERAGNATKQVEGLVRAIQHDTLETAVSVEETTKDVISGTHLAEEAGSSLIEIENVSDQLADLILQLSSAAQGQSQAATHIAETMNVIQEITNQTSQGTQETAYAIGTLADLSNELRRSVAGFKLPR